MTRTPHDLFAKQHLEALLETVGAVRLTSQFGYILIGLPGSGKSTLARHMLSRAPTYRIISTDQIREHLYGDARIQGDWPTVEHQVLSQIQQFLLAGIPIIYDATNSRRQHRIDLLQKLAKLPPAQWIGIYLNTPVDQCKAQNSQRDRQVPEVVIDLMHHELTEFPPNPDEGFAKLYEVPKDLGKRI